MEELYNLKELLMRELKEYGRKNDLTGGSLEIIDKLAHATKNIAKIIMYCEEEEGEYSGAVDRGGGDVSYARANASRMSGRGYAREGSYAYARGRGRGARRNSMGRYSRAEENDEFAQQLEELMQEAPNPQVKQQIQQMLQQLEQM